MRGCKLLVQRGGEGKWNVTYAFCQPIKSLNRFGQPTMAKLFNHVKGDWLLRQIFARSFFVVCGFFFKAFNHYKTAVPTYFALIGISILKALIEKKNNHQLERIDCFFH